MAGESPFADVSPVRQLLRHATEEPRPISQLNPEVPGGLEQVMAWMLAKDPSKRYPTPARAAQALGMFLAANSGEARPTDTSLDVYLAWVDSMDSGRAAPPIAPAPPAPAPRLQKPSVERFVEVVEVADVMEVVEDPRPLREKPRPARRDDDRAERPAPKKEKARRDEDRDERPAPKKEPKAERDEEEDEEEPARIMGMNRRELTVLIIGLVSVFGVAVIGLLVWLVLKLVR